MRSKPEGLLSSRTHRILRCALLTLTILLPAAVQAAGPPADVVEPVSVEAASDSSGDPGPESTGADLLERAQRFSYLASPDEAIEEYEKVLAASPTPRIAQQAQMGIAALEFAKGDYRRARETFSKVLHQRPDWDLVKYGTYQLKEIDRRIAWSGSQEARVAECGVRSLHQVLEARGKAVPIEKVAARVASVMGTASLAELRSAANDFDVDAVGVRLGFDQLQALPKPLIAHLHPNHFVVVESAEAGGLRFLDPDLVEGSLSEERFRERWSGLALLFPEDASALDDVARLSEAEMVETRGGHHLHGNNQGDSSSNPASPFDDGPSSPNPCDGAGLPSISVNLSNFNLLVQDTDFGYGGLGPAVFLQRTYNADDSDSGVFGRSWSFNYGVVIEEQAGGSVNLRRESGKEDFFSLLGCSAGTCTYDPPIWTHDELIQHPDGTFELRVQRTRLIQRFDATGRLTSIEDRNGNAATLGYDAGGRLVTVTDAVGRVTTFTYDANGRVIKVVDPAAREVTFAYDGAGNLTQTVDMAGNVVSYTYDATSYMSSVTTPTGTWTITNVPYDDPAFGLVVESISDPLGHTTRYSTPGLVVVEVEDPNGIVWQYFPINKGELDRVTDPLGNTTNFDYDFDGDLIRVTDALGNVTNFSRDSRGNVTRITDPLGNQLDMSYDGDDNVTQLVDPLGNTTNYLYDENSNLTQITDASGGVTVFSYDGEGQLTSFSDARANTTIFTYDAQGNLDTMTTPLGKQTLYAHDAIGRPTSVTTPRGITRSFEWDGIDRLTKITYPDASEVTFSYNCCQVDSVSGPSGTVSFTYDGANRPVSYTDVWGNTIGYGLDPGGRLTSLTYPDGKVVTYAYDDAGRLTQVTDWLLNTTTYEYDPLGRLTRTDLSNGSVALHAYDDASRLTKLTNVGPDGSILSRYEYTYDALGNRTGVEQYEPVPPSIPDETVSYQNDADNRLTAAGAMTFGYDEDGNLVSKNDGGQVTSYEYDFDGRLVRVEEGSQSTQYLYDDLGTRVGKVENGVEVRFVVNPLARLSQLLMETDASGNPLRYFVYGLGLSSLVGSDARSYSYHYDGAGNVTSVTDTEGSSRDQLAYRPYGSLVSGSTFSTGSRFQFSGRFGVLQDGGLASMRARVYQVQVGRFITPDPLSFSDSVNLYVYVGSNPVNRVDPLGLWALNFQVSVDGVLLGVSVSPCGVFVTSGWGTGAGAGVSVTLSAADPSEGFSTATSLTGGTGLFGIATSVGLGQGGPTADIAIGWGLGWAVSVGATYTHQVF